MKSRRSWLNSANTKLIVTLLAALGSTAAGIITAVRTPSNDTVKALSDKMDKFADEQRKRDDETRKSVEDLRVEVAVVKQRQDDTLGMLERQEKEIGKQDASRAAQHESLTALIKKQDANRAIASVPRAQVEPIPMWNAVEAVPVKSVPSAASASPASSPK